MLLKKTQIVPTLFASSIFFVYLAYTVHAEYYYNSDLIDSLNNDVKQINNNISDKKKRIDSAKDIQSKYVVELTKKQNEKATLQNELALLDNRIAKINLDIEELKMNVELTQLEIQKTQSFIEIKNTEIDKTENNLRTIIQSLNKEGDTNLVEILLLNENLSDFLSKAKYLEDINKGIDTTLKDLMKAKTELEVEKNKLAVKTEELESFKTDLLNSLDSVDQEKKNKEFILEETKNSEEEYQNLIQVAKNEQDAAQRDILNLEQTIRQKLSQIEKNKIQFNDNGFIWPVPKNTITAYFHDPGYPFRYVFEHPAIDIRAKQATPIRAAASGYVARAKDAGKGYSYIMLIHGDGLSTVYGHVSQINVKENQYVTQGQIIGLSGGMPGSPGAGPFTTGSHLHFEIRLNGIPANPLGYLP